MTHIGIPIPEGFTVSTEACNLYYQSKKSLPDYVVEEVYTAIKALEKKTGKVFGGNKNPLLVSVRSGARASMPGMMDTILNLGLNDISVEALASETGNRRFAMDCYRRFILMYTNVVRGYPRVALDKMLDEMKEKKGVHLDTDLDAADLEALVKQYKAFYKKVIGEDFPNDARLQLISAITAVFSSWDNERANIYRKNAPHPIRMGYSS